MTQTEEFVATTRVGPIRVRKTGLGPPAVLWHSLFVDRSSWARVEGTLSQHRSLYVVESPGHGDSPPVGHAYGLEDLAVAATEVLDDVAVAEPVDWLGSALGGHVGIVFAARHPSRCRSLMTMGTPVQALGPGERRQMRLLSLAYGALGARPVTGPLMDVMLGPDAKRDDEDGWEIVADSFRRAGRAGMLEAIRCVSLKRPDLGPLLEAVTSPTVFATNRTDPLWTVDDARAAARRVRDGAVAVLPGDGHIGPLLHSATDVAALVGKFWDDPSATVAELNLL